MLHDSHMLAYSTKDIDVGPTKVMITAVHLLKKEDSEKAV